MARLQEAAVKKIEEICDRHAAEPTPLILILSEIQKEYGYIPLEVQEIVSERTGIPVAEIYGVVTFYALFSMEPKGKYVIRCCDGTACHVRGSLPILNKLRSELGLSENQKTTDDLNFTVETVSCLGACGLAPVLTVNGTVHPAMTPEKASELLSELKKELTKESETNG